jgi:ribonuclease HI
MARSKRDPPTKSAIDNNNDDENIINKLNPKSQIFVPSNLFTLNTPLPRKLPKAKVKLPPTPEAILARSRAREIRDRHHGRVNRIRNLAIGTNHQFPCTVIHTTPEEARANDDVRLADIKEEMENGKCRVYWVDGAVGCSHNTNHGVMGAGVSWMEKRVREDGMWGWKWCTHGVQLGRNTGAIGDAELYAVAEALQLAVREVQRERSDMVKRVRIFTDHQGLTKQLDPLRAGRDSLSLGPTISPRFALQNLFERADWLAKQGVAIELVWVKGHSRSIGNKKADTTANQALATQYQILVQGGKGEGVYQMEAPEAFKNAGEDFAEEWLFRANKWFLIRKGLAVDMDDETEEMHNEDKP